MVISVASGKGGTGKTTIATSLALSFDGGVQFLDCDVEEPNAHIFMKPVIKEITKAFIPVPDFDKSKCNYCGICRKVCEYNAIAVLPPGETTDGNLMFFAPLCHGCGACSYLCPNQAIKEVAREIGVVETGDASGIEFVHGRLNIGEAMAPPLIRKVKEYIDTSKTVIIDVPPGTSCPVVVSLRNCDFCILVTEPTPFGLNDLVLAVEVLRKLAIPFGVVLNRSDLGNVETENYCANEGIPILMKVPFDENIASAYAQGIPLVEVLSEYRKYFLQLFGRINDIAIRKKQ